MTQHPYTTCHFSLIDVPIIRSMVPKSMHSVLIKKIAPYKLYANKKLMIGASINRYSNLFEQNIEKQKHSFVLIFS